VTCCAIIDRGISTIDHCGLLYIHKKEAEE